MPTLYLLGTGAAFSDAHRTTTMLALSDGSSTLVIDCGGDVVQRLLAAGIALDTLTGLILTHEHIDHVGGFPLFMEKVWLAGRREPVPVYGIAPALNQARRCFETFDTSGWDGLPVIEWHPFPEEEHVLVLDDSTWRVTASPGVHGKPVMGVRVTHRASKGVVAYSCDTEPTPAIVALAREADILVHEATGAFDGHSTPQQAAEVAARAGVQRLLLVHLPPGPAASDLEAAQSTFPATAWGGELGTYAF